MAIHRDHIGSLVKTFTHTVPITKLLLVATTASAPEIACAEIAQFVRQLIDNKKVENANQIAFLFPSLKYRGVMNVQVRRMKEALEHEGFLA